MIGEAPRSVITGVPGWESEAEQYHLLRMAQQVPNGGVIVEIGAGFGMSASIFICGTNSSCWIWSIDLFPESLLSDHWANLREAGLGVRSRQLIGDSAAIGESWKSAETLNDPSRIDLLFIDGDHSYAGAKRDIEAWIPHVRSGGKVLFHDAAPATNLAPHLLHFEVQRAIDEWATQTRWPELAPVDSIRTFVKP